MKEVLVTARSFGQYSKESVDLLEQNGFKLIYNPYGRPLKELELIPLIKNADGMIAGLDEITANVLTQAKKLKVVAKNGVGLDNIDLKAAENLGIKVTNTPGCNQYAVAELAVAMMLNLARSVTVANNSVKSGAWKRFVGYGLFQKTIGIIGLGNIGREVIKRLKGFAPTILAYDPYQKITAIDDMVIENTTLEELLERSDIVSLHVPLVAETRNIIDDQKLSMMKDKAYIINTARGGLVDEKALYTHLTNGHLSGAGLDAFANEPPLGNKLLELDNVICTPHIGAYTYEALNKMGMMCAQAIVKYLQEV